MDGVIVGVVGVIVVVGVVVVVVREEKKSGCIVVEVLHMKAG